MQKLQPFSRKIAKVFVTIAAVILLFYSVVVELTVHYAENLNSQTRLSLIAPHHLTLFDNDHREQTIQVTPINSIYSHYHLLPEHIKKNIEPTWTGLKHLGDEGGEFEFEFSVYAQKNERGRIVYAVEDISNIEWDDFDFLLVEAVLLCFGIIIFLVSAGFITNSATKLSAPFTALAKKLQQESDQNLSPMTVEGELSQELSQTLDGINHFRARIKEALEREQSFTRYVSHELRTPMTVVKGSLSLLRRNEDPMVAKQVKRIEHAMEEMEQLTQTFLLLARDEDENQSQCELSQQFLDNIERDIAKRIASNNVTYQADIKQTLDLKAESVLVRSLISNLVLNAINCSIDGTVNLSVTQEGIKVIDNGVGLDGKSRGYEGFGIGLNVVRDICNKYRWQFSLVNNPDQGCTATVSFVLDETIEEY